MCRAPPERAVSSRHRRKIARIERPIRHARRHRGRHIGERPRACGFCVLVVPSTYTARMVCRSYVLEPRHGGGRLLSADIWSQTAWCSMRGNNMPDDPAYIRNFKQFTRAELTFADVPEFEKETFGGNDRARAIMLASVAETALEIFVRHKLRPTFSSDDSRLLFEFNAPLGPLSAKILVPYAFNRYGPDTRHDLDLIRILRMASRIVGDHSGLKRRKLPKCANIFVPRIPPARVHTARISVEGRRRKTRRGVRQKTPANALHYDLLYRFRTVAQQFRKGRADS